MSCAKCRKAIEEEWPRGQSVLRCGAEGERKGHVTEVFPTGRVGVVARREAPRWCPIAGESAAAE